jgi:hypothetical protein
MERDEEQQQQKQPYELCLKNSVAEKARSRAASPNIYLCAQRVCASVTHSFLCPL